MSSNENQEKQQGEHLNNPGALNTTVSDSGGASGECSKNPSNDKELQTGSNLSEKPDELPSQSGDKAEGTSHDNKEDNTCQPKEASGQNMETEETSGVGSAQDESVRVPRTRRRQYRRRSGQDDSSGDEENNAGVEESPARSGVSRLRSRWEEFLMQSSSSDSSQSSLSADEPRASLPPTLEENMPMPKALQKTKPIHKWFAVKEIIGRETGAGGKWQAAERFQHRYYGSLHAVQRLELMYKLEGHCGCVNSLNFNRSGDLLLSASDDRKVVLWDWAADRLILNYDSGHTGNVFQAKFLPLSGDRHIVTCARDGQVRLGVLSSIGVCKGTRLLAQHRRTTHKLATHVDTPHVFLSAGEDALVLSHDVRTSKSNKLLFVKEGGNKVGLYSINSNPVCSNEFIVTGEDQYIRLYDKRKVTENTPLNRFCPKDLLKPNVFLHVTCAVFNHNGTEVVGSYNDDDIYLFDTRQPIGSDYVYKYEGHRNSITVKGVNFFGPRSEFIVSGSDCGNIFFWDKSTEAIVQWMRGDEEGVVNCLEPHPQVPIIATSGLDSDIKIWVPSCEQEPTMKGLKATVVSNQSDRSETRERRSDPFDNQQMRWLWQQIQRFEQRRSAANRTSQGTEDEEAPSSPMEGTEDSPGSSSEEEGYSGRPQCSPS